MEFIKEVINTGAQRAPSASNVWLPESRLFIISTRLSSLSCEGSACGVNALICTYLRPDFVLLFSQSLERWGEGLFTWAGARRSVSALYGAKCRSNRDGRMIWFIEKNECGGSFIFIFVQVKLKYQKDALIFLSLYKEQESDSVSFQTPQLKLLYLKAVGRTWRQRSRPENNQTPSKRRWNQKKRRQRLTKGTKVGVAGCTS